MNFNKLGFYGNRCNSGFAIHLKLFVLVTTISVPNFMLVSRSVQFTENFLLSRRTMPSPAIEMANGYEIQTRVRAHVE